MTSSVAATENLSSNPNIIQGTQYIFHRHLKNMPISQTEFLSNTPFINNGLVQFHIWKSQLSYTKGLKGYLEATCTIHNAIECIIEHNKQIITQIKCRKLLV